MKPILLILTLLFLMHDTSGQSEQSKYKAVADKFVDFYNQDKPDSIFAMFSDDMKKFLPISETIKYFTDLKAGAGKIKKREFIKYESSFALYKTTFERTLYTVKISVGNNAKIDGFTIDVYVDESFPTIKRNSTKLILPFKDEWTVIWGGDTKEQNYHVVAKAQKNAFDLLITNERGLSYKTNGQANEDYYAFGKELLAPCDGEIVLAVDGVKDNKPGVENPAYTFGNAVIIKTTNNEFLVFAHFKQYSVKVKQGQMVKQGQLLGLCGNSGNSSEAHIHFHIQNVEDLNEATGVKCFFDKVMVNGQLKTDYSPVKGERIKPVQK